MSAALITVSRAPKEATGEFAATSACTDRGDSRIIVEHLDHGRRSALRSRCSVEVKLFTRLVSTDAKNHTRPAAAYGRGYPPNRACDSQTITFNGVGSSLPGNPVQHFTREPRCRRASRNRRHSRASAGVAHNARRLIMARRPIN